MRAAVLAVLAALCPACAADVGPTQPWVPAASVAPPMNEELVAPAAGKSAGTAAPSTIRVITYNVDEENFVGATEVADTILADPDLAQASLLFLQEVEHYPGDAQSGAEVIADRLGMGFVFVPARLRDGSRHGLAILSAYPIENVERMELPWVRGRPRIAVRADILVGERTLHVVDVHLDPSLSSTERLAQLRPAVIDAADQVLVAGDFNSNWFEIGATSLPVLTANPATEQWKPLNSYMEALGFTVVSAGSGTTAHGGGYELQLDAIYARGLDARFGAVVRDGPSDHWPLWADVTLP